MKYHQKYEKKYEEKHSHSQLLSVCNLSSSKSMEFASDWVEKSSK